MRLFFLLVFCLFAFPCQAEKISCKIKGAPCYIKPKMIALREEPLLNAKTTFSAIPASESGRYYYLKDIRRSEGQYWGYFKSVDNNKVIDLMTGETLTNEGWLPLDQAFHDIEKAQIIFMKSENEAVALHFFKPDKIMVLIVTKIAQIWFPFDEAGIIDTSKK